MTDKIVMPLGFLAGRPIPIDQAVNHLSSELLGHAADLEELAERAGRRPKDYPQTPEVYLARAEDLRRYGWGAWLIWLQMTTGKPEDLGDLPDLAERFKLTLPPEWTKGTKTEG